MTTLAGTPSSPDLCAVTVRIEALDGHTTTTAPLVFCESRYHRLSA